MAEKGGGVLLPGAKYIWATYWCSKNRVLLLMMNGVFCCCFLGGGFWLLLLFDCFGVFWGVFWWGLGVVVFLLFLWLLFFMVVAFSYSFCQTEEMQFQRHPASKLSVRFYQLFVIPIFGTSPSGFVVLAIIIKKKK